MRKLTLIILLTLICFITGLSTKAQQATAKKVSVELKEVTIENFVTELENQTGFHFYYDPAQFDSLRVSLSVTNVSLQRVLELVFANSEYRFAIPEKESYVLLTKGTTINTSLPPGFFSGISSDSLQQDAMHYYGDKKKTRT